MSPVIAALPYLPHLLVHYGSFSVTNQRVTKQGVVTSQNIPFSMVPQTTSLICWEEPGTNVRRISRLAGRFPF